MKQQSNLVMGMFMAIVLVVQTSTMADLVLNFSIDNGNSFGNSFEIQAGEGLTIGIYLQQTVPDTVLTDEGIVAWGFDLTSSPVGLGNISGGSVNPLFDFENHNVTTPSGFEWEYGETASTGIKGDSVLLGTFLFNTNSAGTTIFTIEDRLVGTGVGNASWVTSSFSLLDEQIFGAGAADTFRFSVTALSVVPEPGSAAILGSLLCLTITTRRRRGEPGDDGRRGSRRRQQSPQG